MAQEMSLEEAIQALRKIVNTTSSVNNPSHLDDLDQLAHLLVIKYNQSDDEGSLDDAIWALTESIKVTKDNNSMLGKRLCSLGSALEDRYLKTAQKADLDKALEASDQAIRLLKTDSPCLSTRVFILRTKYHSTRDVTDRDNVIDFARKAMMKADKNHKAWVTIVQVLSSELDMQFHETKSEKDLEELIRLYSQLRSVAPDGSPLRIDAMTNLSVYLWRRYKISSNLADLNQAIEMMQLILQLTEKSHPRRDLCLMNYGVCLNERFKETGSLDDLNQAIRISGQLIGSMPHDHPDWLSHANDRSLRLTSRFIATGLDEHYYEALHTQREAIQNGRQLLDEGTGQGSEEFGTILLAHGRLFFSHFLKSDLMADLDEAVKNAQESLQLIRDPLSLVGVKIRLSQYLSVRYRNNQQLSDLEERLVLSRQASQVSSPHQISALSSVAFCLRERYYRTMRLADINEAIQVGRRVIESTPEKDSMYRIYESDLGISLGERYAAVGATSDLEESLELTREAAKSVTRDHDHKETVLRNYGTILMKEYAKTGRLSILDEAIQVAEDAITLYPDGNYNLPVLLYQLGERLLQRFYHCSFRADLDRASQVCREALRQRPVTERNRLDLVFILNTVRFLQRPSSEGLLGSPTQSPLEDELETVRKYPGHPLHNAKILVKISIHMGNNFLREGRLAELERAIALGREAAALVPQHHQIRPELLNNLGTLLGLRYTRKGLLHDMNEAILLHREALDKTPLGHFDRPGRLFLLSSQLNDQYNKLGTISVLDEAITLIRESISGTPSQHIELTRREKTLASLLAVRYDAIGRMNDLEEAIRIDQAAIEKVSEDDPIQSWLLDHLAARLRSLYLRTRNIGHLKDAIRYGNASVNSTRESHVDRFARLNNLLACLTEKCKITEEETDFNIAIDIARRAIEASPLEHPSRGTCLNNYGTVMVQKYRFNNDPKNLKIAVMTFRKAIKLTSMDDANQPTRLNNLGSCCRELYYHRGADKFLREAIHWNSLAAQHKSASISSQLSSYRNLLHCFAAEMNWSDASKAASKAISLVPRLILRSLNHSDKQNLLRTISNLACEAASVSMLANQDPWGGLSFLEQGRVIIASSIEDMRTDITELQLSYPEMADKFAQLKTQIENLRNPNTDTGSMPYPLGSVEERQLDETLSRFIADIRTKRGFEDFLLPPSTADIRATTKGGAIVVVNISYLACHAVIIQETEARTIILPHLSEESLVQQLRSSQDLGSERILEWLWDTIAKPVLEELGYNKPPENDEWPHIWWIPTGILGMFPLHAAGRHFQSSSDSVIDRVISSYGLSVKSLVKIRLSSCSNARNTRNALLVGMTNTPQATPLHAVEEEINTVRKYMKSLHMNLVEPRKVKTDVLSEIERCSIFHFAGHGYSNKHDPLSSHIVLGERKQDILTVADLFEINLHKHKPFLAYLSACHTGRMEDETSAEESIHLINAFQTAGFRHVIGTLWRVDDDYCVEMADLIYKEIEDGCMADFSVCLGLHKASRALRSRWVTAETEQRARQIGKLQEIKDMSGDMSNLQEDVENLETWRDIKLYDNANDEDYHWARYIHFGP